MQKTFLPIITLLFITSTHITSCAQEQDYIEIRYTKPSGEDPLVPNYLVSLSNSLRPTKKSTIEFLFNQAPTIFDNKPFSGIYLESKYEDDVKIVKLDNSTKTNIPLADFIPQEHDKEEAKLTLCYVFKEDDKAMVKPAKTIKSYYQGY